MDFMLNEEQTMIQTMARDFAQDILKGHVSEIESQSSAGHFPEDIYQQMCDTGFLAIPFSEEYGGLALGYDSLVLAWEELAKQSPSAACALHISITPMEAIALYGSPSKSRPTCPAPSGARASPPWPLRSPVPGPIPSSFLPPPGWKGTPGSSTG